MHTDFLGGSVHSTSRGIPNIRYACSDVIDENSIVNSAAHPKNAKNGSKNLTQSYTINYTLKVSATLPPRPLSLHTKTDDSL